MKLNSIRLPNLPSSFLSIATRSK